MGRLLTRTQAASYCGVSVPVFNVRCPVMPVALGKSKRLERFDVCALDNWIDKLSENDSSSQIDWLSRIDVNT